MRGGKLLLEIIYPGWRLVPANRALRMHWSQRRKASRPPVDILKFRSGDDAWVQGPHPCRTVEVVRFGPRMMDEDNLHSVVKPVLDWIRCRRFGRGKSAIFTFGAIYDDSPKYCRLKVRQEKGEYGVVVKVYG